MARNQTESVTESTHSTESRGAAVTFSSGTVAKLIGATRRQVTWMVESRMIAPRRSGRTWAWTIEDVKLARAIHLSRNDPGYLTRLLALMDAAERLVDLLRPLPKSEECAERTDQLDRMLKECRAQESLSLVAKK